jgi:phosphonatase-like hydrolase
MIELVVFDMAGTTVQDGQAVHIALQKALAEFDINISIEEANAVMGIPKPIAIEKIIQQKMVLSPEYTTDLIGAIHEVFVREMLMSYQSSKELCEKSHATEIFRSLRNLGIKVFLDTGFSREIANTLIDKLEWKDEIDGSITSDEVERGRPFPDMIFKAMELAGVKEPQKVAKVGDTDVDIQQGLAADCQFVIGITTGAFSKDELAKENPTHLIENLNELMGIISK